MGKDKDLAELIKGAKELCGGDQLKLDSLCRPALEGAQGSGDAAKCSAVVLLRELRGKPVAWQPSAEEAEQEGLPHLGPLKDDLAQLVEMEVMKRLQEMGVGDHTPNVEETSEMVRREVKQSLD